MSNVTQTSIDNYHTLDFSTVRGKVAAEIRRLTKEGKRAYIALVAHNLGLEKSTVAGRFNELREGPFLAKGNWYRMEAAGKHPMPVPTDPIKHRTVETWAIIPCSPPAEQGKLF